MNERVNVVFTVERRDGEKREPLIDLQLDGVSIETARKTVLLLLDDEQPQSQGGE